MAADDDFDLDDDIFDDETDGKVTLKKLWQENPVFKIVVIVGAIIAAYVIYAVFIAADETNQVTSRINQASDVTSIPGEGEVSPAFGDAIREQDRQRAEEAVRSQTSALPTPIGSNEARINVPNSLDNTEEDPLATWRERSAAVEIDSGMDETIPPTDEELPPILDSFAQPPAAIPGNQVQPQVMQPQNQVDPDLTQRFAEQMQVIMGTKQPQAANLITTSYPSPYQQYLDGIAEAEAAQSQQYDAAQNNNFAAGNATDGSYNNFNDGTQDREVLLNAGTVSYAQVINAVNSDLNGPVLAQILSGPMSGGRAIGQFERQDEYLVLTFNRVVKDDKVYSTEAYALDADTTLTGVRSDVNRHWVQRVILPAAAEFIAGVGEAIADTNETTVVVDGGAAVSSEEELDTTEELAKGVERGAERVSEVLEEQENRDVTVTLDKGTPVGLLFTESIYEGDGQ